MSPFLTFVRHSNENVIIMTNKLIYWSSTGIISAISFYGAWGLFASPDFASTLTAMGYPHYFGIMLAFFKIAGGIVLFSPLPVNIKEWAYAGTGINLTAAIISFIVIQASFGSFIAPGVAAAALVISYIYYHKKQ